jgi:hypothetical protein
MTRHQRRIAAWIACFAVLLASLAPSISHALVAAGFSDASPNSVAALAGIPVPRPAPAMHHASHMGNMDMDGMAESEAAPGAAHFAPAASGHHGHPGPHDHDSAMAPIDAAAPQATESPDAAVRSAHSPASHTPAAHSPAMHFEHCPFCFTHAGSFGLPLAASSVIPTSGAAAIAPLLFYRAPQPLFAWSTAQPRAPPNPS